MENPKRAKILLIEDEAIHRQMYGLQFKRAGFENFSTVASGPEGIKKMKEERPDLLLLDVVLEDMDGLEVLQHMRKDKELKDIPVIVLSNIREEDGGEKARRLGAVDYILKAQYLPREVVARVERFLAGQS